jgi:soluble lytic murein transglycosylase-like protein
MQKSSVAFAAFVMALGVSTQQAAANDAIAFFQLNNQQAKQEPVQRGLRTARAARSTGGGRVAGLGPAAGDVARLADQMGVPRNLALSVCRVESHCHYGRVGRAGERGPLQIKLQTARGLGYSGGAAGLNGYTGAYWGMKHLAAAYRRCGTARGAAKLHNAGLASSCSGSAYASRVVARL